MQQGIDRTKETSVEELQAAKHLELTSDPDQLADADVFLVTVPTPIDSSKRPDLTPLENASTAVGRWLRQRAEAKRQSGQTPTTPLVIYEALCIRERRKVCAILESESGLSFNVADPGEGFFCGYSPERINPGDTSTSLRRL